MLESEILEQLQHPSPRVRKAGWLELHDDFRSGRRVPRSDFLLALLDVQAEEQDLIVLKAAGKTVSVASIAMSAREAASTEHMYLSEVDPGNIAVGTWLWAPFSKDSLVVRAADRHAMIRDEDAVIELARNLSRKDFPLTKFPRIRLGTFAPTVDDLNVNAICFVGRLSLYGQNAIESWKLKDGRFRFGCDQRPTSLERGVLDDEYHLVLEYLGEYDEPIGYPTREDNHTRTDYGLVQRHVVRRNSRDFVVLHCAGSSSLGTLAAAHWAAYDLYLPNKDGKLIQFDEKKLKVTANSRLEALLEVTADTHRATLTWELGEVKLLDLRLDGYAWYEDVFDFERQTPKLVLLLHHDGKVKSVPNSRVIGVQLDAWTARLKTKRENYRLFVAMCRLAHDHDGLVDTGKLAEDDWIWNSPLEGDLKAQIRHVKTRLSNLKTNYLGRSLSIDEDCCRLSAMVRYQDC